MSLAVLAVDPYVWDWGDLLFRWLHVVAAVVWIGTSFYFVALDNHLEPPRDPRDYREGLDDRTASLLLKSIERNPADRFQTAADFRDALKLLPPQ